MTTCTWIGRVPAVAQEEELSIGGGWVAADTLSVTVDSATTLTLTIGSTDIDNIGADLVVMLTGVGTLTSGSSVTGYGNVTGEFVQFSSVTFDASTDKVTMVGKTDGRPFTITTAKVTAGTGTFTNASSVSPAGPCDASLAENWENGVPTNGDTVILNGRAQYSIKYNISQAAIAPASIVITSEFSKSAGLPSKNTDNASYPFTETLPTYWAIGSNTTALALTVGYGAGSSMTGSIWLNTGTAAVTALINQTAARGAQAPFRWKGTGATVTFDIFGGDVEVATLASETATLTTCRVKGGTVRIGSGTTVTTFQQGGGTVYSYAALGSAVEVAGGGGQANPVLYYRANGSAVTITKLQQGTIYYESDDTFTLTAFNKGLFDCTTDRRGRTGTAVDLHYGAGFRDPHGTVTFTAGIDLNGITIADLSVLELPVNKKITLGAVT